MFGPWFQLYVKAPEGNGYTTPQAMKRIDSTLIDRFAASFVAPEGLPIREPDGTWEIRVLVADQLKKVKQFITEGYGLEIVREVKNDN